ncbi:Protein of unknown function (DUF1538) [Desulfocurvibacter africanus PCS]|uniref:DUF1538 domain-containing protein n=1 Tax=Desulfocurvibacter africanus PCS TaxID=1262666 RepID=M5Q3C7_DESAF|nr:DUF1538 domain-containing protein [Desulfocurvibacter africanus]EMG38218.1 Protein of unknown function (DUF1538) [Desulfocurvibacter africanus PCS]
MSLLLEFLDMREIAWEVLQALGPILVFFLVLQALRLRLPREYLLGIVKGVALTFVGLVFFLQGVQVGFIPAGEALGRSLGRIGSLWLLLPVGFLLGFAATVAEPAVRVLSYEVEKASLGRIKGRTIVVTLSLGVATLVALAMLRVTQGTHILYFLIPGYLAAIVLMRFVSPAFVAIAFDSGAVATGPMTATFVMSLMLGIAAQMEGRDPIRDGFGLIAMVTMAPIIAIMCLGCIQAFIGRER